MKIQRIILTGTAAFSLLSPPVIPAAGPMGGDSMGGSQPQAPQVYPVPQARQPSEGEVWDSLDKTLSNVQRKREQEAEVERLERGGAHDRRMGGPMSRGERESDREYFTDKHRERARRLSSVVHRREKLVNDMLKMYRSHPSQGLEDAIKRNSSKLSAERQELRKSREFIERNR